MNQHYGHMTIGRSLQAQSCHWLESSPTVKAASQKPEMGRTEKEKRENKKIEKANTMCFYVCVYLI